MALTDAANCVTFGKKSHEDKKKGKAAYQPRMQWLLSDG
jgi:hypothetical protein